MNKYKFIIFSFALIFSLSGVFSCISQKPGVDAPDDIIHFPIGVAVHPAGRYAAVVNGNFNKAYKNGSVVFIDLTNFEIVSEWTEPVGSFGGEVIFNKAGTRMFVSVRGPFYKQQSIEEEEGDVLLAFDIDIKAASEKPGNKDIIIDNSRKSYDVAADPFGIAIDVDDRYIYVTHLSNGELTVLQDDVGRFTDSSDEEKHSNGEYLRRCMPLLQSCDDNIADGTLCGSCSVNTDCDPVEVMMSGDLGAVPFKSDSTCLGNPREQGKNFCATYCETDKTVLDDDNNVVRLGCPDNYRCEIVRPLHIISQRKFSRGGNQVALSPLTGTAYITHKDANVLGVMRPYYVSGIGYQARVEQVAYSDGYDLRGLAFNPLGTRLYVSARNLFTNATNKPGILVIDTSLENEGCHKDQFVGETTSCERNRMIDFFETDSQPANIALYKEKLYVLLYGTDEMYIIDTVSRQVVGLVDLAPEVSIEKPGIFREDARPYDISIFENESGAWALVTHFQAHEVAVIHLVDKDGNSVNQIVRKIENRAKLYEEDQF